MSFQRHHQARLNLRTKLPEITGEQQEKFEEMRQNAPSLRKGTVVEIDGKEVAFWCDGCDPDNCSGCSPRITNVGKKGAVLTLENDYILIKNGEDRIIITEDEYNVLYVTNAGRYRMKYPYEKSFHYRYSKLISNNWGNLFFKVVLNLKKEMNNG